MDTPNNDEAAAEPVAEGPAFKSIGSLTLEEFDALKQMARAADGESRFSRALDYLTWTMIFFVGVFAVYFPIPHPFRLKRILGTVFIALPILIAVCLAVARWHILRCAKRGTYLFAPTETSVSLREVSQSFEGNRLTFGWNRFDALYATSEMAVLTMRKSRQYVGLVRRHMQEPAQWNDMLAQISKRVPRFDQPPILD